MADLPVELDGPPAARTARPSATSCAAWRLQYEKALANRASVTEGIDLALVRRVARSS